MDQEIRSCKIDTKRVMLLGWLIEWVMWVREILTKMLRILKAAAYIFITLQCVFYSTVLTYEPRLNKENQWSVGVKYSLSDSFI